MAKISAALIKELRDATGAGMMDVKKALEEAEGDVARAKELIRERLWVAEGPEKLLKVERAHCVVFLVAHAIGFNALLLDA